MRIVFYDHTPVDYTPETPFVRPLGGSESALCYLSIELARLGHSVALITNTSAPGRYRGVDCSNHRDSSAPRLLHGADIIIASNEALGRGLRDNYRVTKPLVLWVQHAVDQPAIRALESAREKKMWTAFAFVSRWQLEQFADVFWIPEDKSRVMRNAVSPPFAEPAPPEPWFHRSDPPVLVYTSQPYRGLSVLLDAMPMIRASIPGTRLKVFSGFAATYRTALTDDPYLALYQRCMTTDAVDYVGPIAQTALAQELGFAAALAYPSIFLETSCIVAMEAMASGMTVLTTRTGALPETTAGFGHMIEPQSDHGKLAQAFAELTVDALRDAQRNPEATAARRQAQIAYAREYCTWPRRALEWETWLADIVRNFSA